MPQPDAFVRSRTAGGRSGSAIRSTTSPRGACRSCSTSRWSKSATAVSAKRTPVTSRRRPAPEQRRCQPRRLPTCCRGASGAAATVAEALRARDSRATGVEALHGSPAGRLRLAPRSFARSENSARAGDRRSVRWRRGHGAEVVPFDSGWVDSGISLGIERGRAAARRPASRSPGTRRRSRSPPGWARYVLERRYRPDGHGGARANAAARRSRASTMC